MKNNFTIINSNFNKLTKDINNHLNTNLDVLDVINLLEDDRVEKVLTQRNDGEVYDFNDELDYAYVRSILMNILTDISK